MGIKKGEKRLSSADSEVSEFGAHSEGKSVRSVWSARRYLATRYYRRAFNVVGNTVLTMAAFSVGITC